MALRVLVGPTFQVGQTVVWNPSCPLHASVISCFQQVVPNGPFEVLEEVTRAYMPAAKAADRKMTQQILVRVKRTGLMVVDPAGRPFWLPSSLFKEMEK